MKWFWDKEKATIQELQKNFKIYFWILIILLIVTLVLSSISIIVFDFVGITIFTGVLSIHYGMILLDVKKIIRKRMK